jgi:hypothetical protein
MNVCLVRVHAASYNANRIGGVMVRVLTSIAVDRGFEPQSGQLDFYSAKSLKQQSADRNVSPLGHIILILSRPVFVLSP